jgi:hypothetical protein
VRITEKKNVGGLLYGKNVAYVGLTRLPTEYLLYAINFSSPLWNVLKPWTTVQSRFDITQKVANLHEKRKDVVVERVFSGLGFWEDENREECQLGVVGEHEPSMEKRC